MMIDIRKKRRLCQQRKRQGATLVESALTLVAFLMIVFGILDLGIGLLRYNTLSAVARIGGRAAIVHGSHAAPAQTIWNGQNAVDGVTAAISPVLNAEGIATSDISVTVTYTDGPDRGTSSNDPGDTVTIQVSAPFQPTCTAILGISPMTLTARTSMIIAH
jgi:Flp pilus assembly protein TadG